MDFVKCEDYLPFALETELELSSSEAECESRLKSLTNCMTLGKLLNLSVFIIKMGLRTLNK